MRAIRDHDQQKSSLSTLKQQRDIEFLFPFGWGELWGIADRTDYDLNSVIRTVSGARSVHTLMMQRRKSISHMLLSHHLGADRVTLAFLCAQHTMKKRLKTAMTRTCDAFPSSNRSS